MKFNISLYKQLLKTIARLDDSPKKLALSFAVGVYISVSPFFGIHTILAIVLSLTFGLNKVSTIAGSWVSMPWFLPFIYYLEYRIGAFLLNKKANFILKPFTLEHYFKNGSDAFTSILTGSIIVGLLCGIIFYFLLKYIIEMYRRRKHVSSKG